MSLDRKGAWQLENDHDPTREALRKDNLRAAYETERAGYLAKADNADDETQRERYLKRARGVEDAVKNEGLQPLPSIKALARA